MMNIFARLTAVVGLSVLTLPAFANPVAANVVASDVDTTTLTVEVGGEFRDRYIHLDDALALPEYQGLEIVGVDVVGRRASARTLLTLWINDSVQNSEWMSRDALTLLTPHAGWIVGQNATSLQIYVSGSSGFVSRVEIRLRAPESN